MYVNEAGHYLKDGSRESVRDVYVKAGFSSKPGCMVPLRIHVTDCNLSQQFHLTCLTRGLHKVVYCCTWYCSEFECRCSGGLESIVVAHS